MYIYQDIALREFKPWAGEIAVFERLTTDEIDQIEDILNEVNEHWSKTEINDLFWFDTEWILETLNIDEDEFWKREGV